MKPFPLKSFIRITLLTSIWINASEVFRYFVFVRPNVQAYFPEREDIANIDLGIFAIWGLWDTLLTAVLVFSYWLYSQAFGANLKAVVASGTWVWLAIFVIFWVATANMGLSNWNLLGITLPLSWIEMGVGAWIAHKLYARESLELSMER